MRLYALIASFCLIAFLPACKKSTVPLSPLASLNVVNASINLGAVKVNFTDLKGLYSSITTTVAYSGNTAYAMNAEQDVPVTIVPSADTTKIAFTGRFNFPNGSMYSLYLAGLSPAVDTILEKDNIPSYNDSLCGVRFINLSYNSVPVKVVLSTSTTVTEFGPLAYKQGSAFKTYPAKLSTGTYTFQVRDAVKDTVMGSYTLSVPRFFSCTLAWKGMIGASGTNAPGVMKINNF